MVELVGDQRPALVLAPDQVGGRHPDVLVERVVDVVVAGQPHGDDLDARRVHRDHEHRDALVLGGLGVGPRGQPDVVGVAGQRGVDLLAVDHVLVTVADGPGLQRGEVGARLGLGVADAEVDVAGQDLREEELLLLVGAVVHDRRAHRVDGQHGHGRAGPHRLVEEDELLDGALALATPLLGPPDAEPAVGGHLLDHPAHVGADAVALVELLLDLGSEELVVVLAQFVAERLMLLGVADLHGVPPGPVLSARGRAITTRTRYIRRSRDATSVHAAGAGTRPAPIPLGLPSGKLPGHRRMRHGPASPWSRRFRPTRATTIRSCRDSPAAAVPTHRGPGRPSPRSSTCPKQ